MGIAEGLPQSTVNCIIQDDEGFMWIGTNAGVARYDGYNFKTFSYDKSYKKGLGNIIINCLELDNYGNILIGTESGLFLYDRKKESFLLINESKDIAIYKLKRDSRNNVWIGSNEGLWQYNAMNKSVVKNIVLTAYKQPNSPVESIEEDNNHSVWVSYRNGALIHFNTSDKQVLPLSAEILKALKNKGTITVIRKNPVNGSVWLGSNYRGIIHINKYGDKASFSHTGMQDTSFPSKFERLRDLHVEGDKVWIGTRIGLFVLDENSGNVAQYTQDIANPESLSNNSITCFFKDKGDNIWIGTYNGGINIVQTKMSNFSYIQTGIGKPGLTKNLTYAIAEDGQGKLWIGTGAGGLNCYDPEDGQFSNYHIRLRQKHIEYDYIESLCLVKDTLWAGTLRGFYKFDIRGKIFREYHLNNVNNPKRIYAVFALCGDKKQGLWIGTQQGLFHRYANGGLTCYESKNGRKDSLAEGKITALLQDHWGGVWIGRENGLSYKPFNEHRFINFSQLPNMPANAYVYTIFEDSYGIVWIGTNENGLLYYNPATKQFGVIDDRYGLLSQSVRAINNDKEGNLWISSINAISKIEIKKSAFPFSAANLKIHRYSLENGLKSNEFLQATCLTKGGSLLFGGTNGICSFTPDSMYVNTYKPPVVFTGFQINNHSVSLQEEGSPFSDAISYTNKIVLKHNQAYITIQFAALNYINPKSNQYAYTLDGLKGDQWHSVGNERSVTYPNLSPGKYVFKVKASNNDGYWNEQYTSLEITVLPPIWATWYAYLFYAFLIIGILFTFYSYSLKANKLKHELQLQQAIIEKEKEFSKQKIDFFTNISHEIKTPLTLVLAPLAKILSAVNNNQQVQHQYLILMQRNGDILMKLIDQLLDFRRVDAGVDKLDVQRGDICAFIKGIVDNFQILAQREEILLSFTAPDTPVITAFDEDKLEKIMFNLISNALKFTEPGGNVMINVFTKKGNNNKAIVIKVEDNGAGINPEHLDKIFEMFHHYENEGRKTGGAGIGLSFTKKLVALHGGTIEVESKIRTPENEGYTCFTICLPIDSASNE